MAEPDIPDLLDVLGSIAKHLLLEDRTRVLWARDKLQTLERENAALRSAQRIQREAMPSARPTGDAWDVPTDPQAEELARLRADNARLYEENARLREELARRPLEIVPEEAKPEPPADGEPITRGSYR